MKIILPFILFFFCCMLADAIHHFYLTRLERRIGLSGSTTKILTLNIPSYFRNILRMIMMFLSVYFWKEQTIFIIFIALIIKLSTKNRQYGYGPIDIASLATLVVSSLYVHFFKINGVTPGISILGTASFIVSMLGIYIFSKDKEEPQANGTFLIMALNTSFIGSYYSIDSLYVLFPISVFVYFLQTLCEWFVPKTNTSKKMEHSVKAILLSSLIILAIAVALLTLKGRYPL